MIEKVGIVGCGTMGAGITQAVLEAGYKAVVTEIDVILLDKGISTVKKGLERSIEKGTLSQIEQKKKPSLVFRVRLPWRSLIAL